MPFVAFYHTHKLVVTLFVLIYLIKAILLLMGNKETLDRFSRFIRIPEIVVSALFLITGGVMLVYLADFNTLFLLKLIIVAITIPLAVIAFKRYNKLLAVLVVVLLISAYGLAEMYKASFGKKEEVSGIITATSDANYSITEHGKALFNAQCVVCHGEDGKANLAGAKDLTISVKTDEEIAELIKNGKNAMPGMAKIYNEEEINALIKYVTTLR